MIDGDVVNHQYNIYIYINNAFSLIYIYSHWLIVLYTYGYYIDGNKHIHNIKRNTVYIYIYTYLYIQIWPAEAAHWYNRDISWDINHQPYNHI